MLAQTTKVECGRFFTLSHACVDVGVAGDLEDAGKSASQLSNGRGLHGRLIVHWTGLGLQAPKDRQGKAVSNSQHCRSLKSSWHRKELCSM